MTVPSERGYWPTSGWRVSSPESEGLDGPTLGKIDEYARQSMPPIRAVVIVRHGHIVFEGYYDGSSADSYHSVNSITKSVMSMLVGIALRDGLISGVDQPVLELLPEYDTSDLDARKRELTVRHLLTMTSGLDFDRSEPALPLSSGDMTRSALARPLTDPPGSRFRYDDLSVHLLSIIITRVTGLSAASFAQRELFGRLGIWTDERSCFIWRAEPNAGHSVHRRGNWPDDGLAWRVDQHGHSIAGFGLHLTAREMAKLGYLYLNRGWWDGHQLVPADFVQESTREHNGGGPPVGRPYGYLWWVGRGGSFLASGFGGQSIQVDPRTDLVVAYATMPPRNSSDGITRGFVVPALKQ